MDSDQDACRYTRDEVWDIYREIGVAERHFNSIQERYRIIASSWLVATVAGTAYLVVHREDFGTVPVEILVAALAHFGSIGICLLWILDIKVFQVLLASYYEEALALERGVPWLPPIRRRIRIEFKGRLPELVSLYYVGSALFLFILGAGALASFVVRAPSISEAIRFGAGSVSVLALLDLVAVATVYRRSQQPEALLEDAASLSAEARERHYSQATISR